MIENLEGISYYIFSALCFLAFVFVILAVRETKGLSLEEIEKYWNIH
jgi:SP family xylose:H+ symportor-like MFS transporter